MAKRPLNPFYISAEKKGQLTEMELKVVRLVCLGCQTQAVAAILARSFHTVANHKNRAMRKLGVRNAVGLTRRAFQLGIVPISELLTLEELQRLKAAGMESPDSITTHRPHGQSDGKQYGRFDDAHEE